MSLLTTSIAWLAPLVSAHANAPVEPGAAALDPVTIKIATVAPEGSTWMNVLEDVKRQVYLRTRGRVNLRFYPGGIAGEEGTVLEKIHYGQLHGAGLTGVGMGEILPASRIMELPFYFDDYADYDYVLEALRPEFEEGFRENGFELLGWAEGGFANLYSRTSVADLELLRASKVWLRTGDPLRAALLDALGIDPVPLALSDVLTSLQTGLVETVYVSPLALVALQWFPHLEHALALPVFNIQAGLVVDKEIFDSLSEADQAAVRTAAADGVARLVELTRADNAEAEEVLREKGIVFATPDEATRNALLEVRQAVAGALTGEVWDEELFARFETLVAEARAAREESR